MLLTFVCHMETDWNFEGRFTAQAFHLRLNPTGTAQAERMADRLKHIAFRHIVTSDQLRAIETAVTIAGWQESVLNFITDPRLREVNVGSLVGTKRSEVVQPEFRTKHPQFDFRPIGGEYRAGVIARLRDCLDEVKAKCGTGETLIVSHGTALRILFEDMGFDVKLTRENFVRVEY